MFARTESLPIEKTADFHRI